MENIFLAHILGIASKSTDSLSVGTPKTALIFALLLSAAILFFYLVMDRLPKNKKSKITAKNEPKFIKTMIGFATGTMLAAGFDAWWHVAVVRESFFVPPHIFLYGFSTAGIVLSFYIWLQTRDSHWKHTLFTLLIIPLAGAFDNFWHT